MLKITQNFIKIVIFKTSQNPISSTLKLVYFLYQNNKTPFQRDQFENSN